MEKQSDLERAAEIAFSALLPAAQKYFREMGLVPAYLRRPFEERKTAPETADAIRTEINALCGATGRPSDYNADAHNQALSYFAMMLR